MPAGSSRREGVATAGIGSARPQVCCAAGARKSDSSVLRRFAARRLMSRLKTTNQFTDWANYASMSSVSLPVDVGGSEAGRSGRRLGHQVVKLD